MKNIIITGSGRSGTSLVAGILAKDGYYIGTDYIRPTDSNPKGFFEGQEINDVNEKILEKIVATRSSFTTRFLRRVPFLEEIVKNDRPIKGKGQLWLARVPLDAHVKSNSSINDQIRHQTARVPFCFKDPRFCYTLPVWRPFLDNHTTVFVCVFRDPGDTIKSILQNVIVRNIYVL